MLYTALIIVDVLLASSLIALVMLQQGKGADAGAAFGSGSSGTVFGAAGGASLMQKITTGVAVLFFAITLGLSIMAKDRVSSAVKQAKPTSVVQGNVPVEAEKPAVSAMAPVALIPEVEVETSAIEAAGAQTSPVVPEIPVSDTAPVDESPVNSIPVPVE